MFLGISNSLIPLFFPETNPNTPIFNASALAFKSAREMAALNIYADTLKADFQSCVPQFDTFK